MKFTLVKNGRYLGLSGEVKSNEVDIVETMSIENALTFPKIEFAKKFVDKSNIECEIREVDNE